MFTSAQPAVTQSAVVLEELLSGLLAASGQLALISKVSEE